MLAIYDEYRASEDIDLYDPNAEDVGNEHEEEMAEKLAKRLNDKGFEIKARHKNNLYVGPSIKLDVFNNGVFYRSINKKDFDQIKVLLFDIQTYADMKIHSLLCRSFYDARDLVDLFIIKKETGCELSFPSLDCDIIEKRYEERLREIKKTTKEDLFVFQTRKQINELPYEELDEFRRWIYEWLSEFC
ncbi:MAG: nucleotidyl transferase AbiEii/AbiGii toxin family protein [Candidatus Thermoplasmatota archaeon]